MQVSEGMQFRFDWIEITQWQTDDRSKGHKLERPIFTLSKCTVNFSLSTSFFKLYCHVRQYRVNVFFAPITDY